MQLTINQLHSQQDPVTNQSILVNGREGGSVHSIERWQIMAAVSAKLLNVRNGSFSDTSAMRPVWVENGLKSLLTSVSRL